MSAIIFHLFLGYRCDKRDCGAEFHVNPHKGWTEWSPEPRREAREQGWTFWVGRSNKVLCPKHLPSKGSKLEESTR